MNADRFFTVVLIRAITERMKEFAMMKGVVTFEVLGDKTYTLRFGDVEEPVIEGWRGPSNLWLTFASDAFTAFTQGTLSLDAALDSGSLRVRGNPAFLTYFTQLLQPRTNALGVRFGRF